MNVKELFSYYKKHSKGHIIATLPLVLCVCCSFLVITDLFVFPGAKRIEKITKETQISASEVARSTVLNFEFLFPYKIKYLSVQFTTNPPEKITFQSTISCFYNGEKVLRKLSKVKTIMTNNKTLSKIMDFSKVECNKVQILFDGQGTLKEGENLTISVLCDSFEFKIRELTVKLSFLFCSIGFFTILIKLNISKFKKVAGFLLVIGSFIICLPLSVSRIEYTSLFIDEYSRCIMIGIIIFFSIISKTKTEEIDYMSAILDASAYIWGCYGVLNIHIKGYIYDPLSNNSIIMPVYKIVLIISMIVCVVSAIISRVIKNENPNGVALVVIAAIASVCNYFTLRSNGEGILIIITMSAIHLFVYAYPTILKSKKVLNVTIKIEEKEGEKAENKEEEEEEDKNDSDSDEEESVDTYGSYDENSSSNSLSVDVDEQSSDFSEEEEESEKKTKKSKRSKSDSDSES